MGKRKLKINNSYDWVVVRFVDDNIIQLCAEKSFKKKIIIGQKYHVKWKDGYKYLAEVLKTGTKHDMEDYINSGRSTFLLKNDDTLFDEELNVPNTSKENCMLPECKKVVTDDIHLLNNVETKVISIYFLRLICSTFILNNIIFFNLIVAAQPRFTNMIDSNPTELCLNENDKLIDEELNVPNTSKENCMLPECEKVVTDDIHLLNNVETKVISIYFLRLICSTFILNNIYFFNLIVAVQPSFTNMIDSNPTELCLNENDKLFNEELNVPNTSKENCILPESEKILTDDIHLLNNVETEAIQPIFENWINYNNGYDLAPIEIDQQQYSIEDWHFDKLMQNDPYNFENETVDILTSESNQNSKTKYIGLRPKKSSVLKQSSNSESSVHSDNDSESDYLPPNINLTCESSDEISYKSDFNIDQLSDIHYSDISQSSTTPTILNQKDILNNEVIESTKLVKKGYRFNGLVETSKIKQISNKRSWDKTTNCIYCEKNVTNFTRHIMRNHSMEFEVARYLSLPKGSNERVELADNIRKRGNFLCNVGEVDVIKPVRRPNEFSKTIPDASNYLPCKHCYGMYKKKYLYRHEKKCKSAKTKQLGRNRAQSNAQNLLLAFSNTDQDLVTKVFPRMAVDNISFVAKSDELIKAFGSRYLKSHREKHLVHVVTQKMRTLARLLIQMQLEYPSIKTLQECLLPKHFDLIVKCTKTVAGYDISKDLYGAPSVVLKIGNMLKQCCDIAEFTLLKHCNNLALDEAQSSTQKAIINMRSIIEKQWSYEVSTNASKEILQKKWNKPAFLPLTSDIQLFRNHLIHVQNVSIQELKNNPNNQKSFKNLEESVLAQLILLNRRRSGEVQRLFINTYLTAPIEISQEEVDLSLSEMERQLTKQLKRIVIRGKRGRGVPILFTPTLQKTITFLLKTREVVDFIDENNPYLFALPHSLNSIRGSDAIRKLSIDSGAKNPENLTSTKLRKQVATIAQILNLSDGDLEQLSTFLGHSKDVHKQFYRLSESAFQVAKVSKLLLMLENERGQEFRGKNLDEININVDALVSDVEDYSSEDDKPLESLSQDANKTVENVEKVQMKKIISNKFKSVPFPKKNLHPDSKKFVRVPWTDAEKKVTTEYFQKHILLNKVPKKEECDNLKKQFPEIMINKPWKKIKTFIHNIINSHK
ncbi:hypothetical protein ACI65C_006317 [Semiaphis heraclei]